MTFSVFIYNVMLTVSVHCTVYSVHCKLSTVYGIGFVPGRLNSIRKCVRTFKEAPGPVLDSPRCSPITSCCRTLRNYLFVSLIREHAHKNLLKNRPPPLLAVSGSFFLVFMYVCFESKKSRHGIKLFLDDRGRPPPPLNGNGMQYYVHAPLVSVKGSVQYISTFSSNLKRFL